MQPLSVLREQKASDAAQVNFLASMAGMHRTRLQHCVAALSLQRQIAASSNRTSLEQSRLLSRWRLEMDYIEGSLRLELSSILTSLSMRSLTSLEERMIEAATGNAIRTLFGDIQSGKVLTRQSSLAEVAMTLGR